MNLSSIKEKARNALRGNWGLAIVASIIASVCGASGNGGGGSVNIEFEESDMEAIQGTEFGEIMSNAIAFIEEHLVEILAFVGIFAAVGFVMSILMFCLGSIVKVGYNKFNLNLIDSYQINIGTLFSYFKHWKSAILSNLLATVYISLWSLLCLIPGIIATYKYAMVPYIIAERPELSPQEALNESARLMQGNKWNLFKLEWSFIGWHLLCILSCGIGYIWLVPYINASTACFYRELTKFDFVTQSRNASEPSATFADAWENQQ